ncbi:MAG: hypothetical protein KY437_05985 [Actinobacteria bacterium]|nr:hypothetical protein [Actinomycetota bacterium]
MITGLVQVRGRGARRPTARRTSQLVAVIAVLAVLGAGTQLVLAQDGDGEGASAEDLVQRLVEIEDQVAGVPFLPDVTVQPETTWGVINGDFVGARVLLDEVADDLDSLVNDASDADGEVAEAVETVANSYRTMREGYGYLAAYEQAGLGVEPPPAEDEGDTPPAAAESGDDEPRGQAEVGLGLLLEALAGFADGYDILRNVDEAADARSLFEVRYSETQQAAQTEALDVRTALSYPVVNLLVAVDRFDPQFGGEPPAQVVRYACVDRGPYLEDRSEGNVPDLPMPEGEQAELPIPDCPNLNNGNETRLMQPGADSN